MLVEGQGQETQGNGQIKRHKRFEALEKRDVDQDGFVKEWPEVGLIAMGSPEDPAPSIKIEDGVIVEMDGVAREDFDLVDDFVARTAIDNSVAEEMMALNAVEIARKLVDINVPLAPMALFPQAPSIDLPTYRHIARNAAQYAKGDSPSPVPQVNDPMARPKWQAISSVFHIHETEFVRQNEKPVELSVNFKGR